MTDASPGFVTVADAVVSRIARDGIDTVFGLTGGGIMYLIDALARSPDARLQPVHHEEFAGVAADGYARSGKPYGVAFATTGPGAAHLFAAVAAAWQDSSPVLFVVGQVKSADSRHLRGISIRQNGTFEFDTTAAFAPICKSVAVVARGDDIHDIVDRAILLCRSGRPGPVVVEIPLDVQGALVPATEPAASATAIPHEESFVAEMALGSELNAALQRALNRAARPLVLVGVGVVRAGLDGQLAQLLAAYGVPYVVTQFARGAGRLEDGLFLGSPGIKANRSANIAITECDALIAIGTSLHQQVTGWDTEAFSSLPSWKIWCEPDAEVLQTRHSLVDQAFNLPAESAIVALATALKEVEVSEGGRWDEWRERCAVLRDRALLHYPDHVPVTGRMCLYRAVSTMSQFAGAFSAAVTDAGVTWYVLAQHYFPAAGSHYVSSGSFGAMGTALPMAIGAACATRGRVLAFTGDGSLMTSLSEMATLRECGLPVVLIVNSNDGYLSIKTTHDRYFQGRRIGTDATNGVFIPPIRDLAAVFNLPFRRASTEDELTTVLQEVTDDRWEGPVVVELMTFVDQSIEPIVQSKRGSDGSFVSATLADMSPPWRDDHDR